jgi:hypothetical protein
VAIPTFNVSLIPRFPANVVGDGPITVDRNGLTYTFGFDLTSYAENPSPSTNALLLSYDPEDGQTGLIAIEDLATPSINARLSDIPTAEAGVDNEKLITPLTAKASIVANAKDGEWEQAGTGSVTRTIDEKLKESLSVADKGAVGGGSAAALEAAFQATIDALGTTGRAYVPPGDYSALVPGDLSLNVNATITLDLAPGVTLPAGMPVALRRSGTFTLPETSIQADKTVNVFNRLTLPSKSGDSNRMYGNHVDGFVPTGGSGDHEIRGYSADIGTSKQLAEGGSVYAVKVRVYADGGSSNIRGVYGFAEAINGSGSTATLTGVLGTIYTNGNPVNEAIGVRSHVDTGATAAFEAAGAKTTETNAPSFGYRTRGGSGQPILPTSAHFAGHGGSAGDIFRGFKSHLDSTDIFRVRNDGYTLTQGLLSRGVTIADDEFLEITPPEQDGFIKFWFRGTTAANAEAYFNMAGSGSGEKKSAGGAGAVVLQNTTPTGTTGVDGNLTLCVAAGKLYLENRTGASRNVRWQFTAL